MNNNETIYTAEIKTKLVLQLLRKEKTVDEIVHLNSITSEILINWRDIFLENAELTMKSSGKNSGAGSDFNCNSKSITLNPDFTFENFIDSENNNLAYSVALSIAQSTSIKYNPLYIYGQSGIGKSHLLHAICHEKIKNNSDIKISYISADQFVIDFISSIRNRSQEIFRKEYINSDILIIENIQLFENKEETSKEFIQLFEILHQNNKQIIISSDKPPKELSTIQDRLKTRFEWGLVVGIESLNFDDCVKILKEKLKRKNISLSNEVIDYVAKRIQSSVRALESAIAKIEIISELKDDPISISLVQEELKNLFDEDE